MPTTRSAAKQSKLDDFENVAGPKKESKSTKDIRSPVNKANKSTKAANSSAKRKAAPEPSETPAKKKARANSKSTKQAHFADHNAADLEKPIIINRSPVLQLWAATVAQFLHEDESWDTCLSIGGAISTLCAVAKGRAIGKIEPKDDSAGAQDAKAKRKKQTTKEASRDLEVMGFPMHIKDGVVVVDGKSKPLKENLLRNKFGNEENYKNAKSTMYEALQTWKDDTAELDKKAFHMYEKFRPNVASGSSGWGRKGELNLHEVRSTIEKA